MSSTTTVRATLGAAARALLGALPAPARLRVRQVKRAALGQEPVPTGSRAKAPSGREPARPEPPPPVPAPPPEPPPPPAPAPVAAGPDAPGPRRAEDGSSRLETRRRHVFATADRSGRGLEIGPAHNAVLPKREGFSTKTVDYLDRSGLIEKYQAHPQYSPDDIEEVDFVLPPGAAMADVIGERFDLVLASHVIEHTTSLVDFVNECARLLEPGGVLALIVPDHRFCFDRFRERSAIGAVIDATHDPGRVHTVGTLTEFALYAVRHRGTTSWAPQHRGDYSFVHDEENRSRIVASATSGSYVDVHHWVFTPHHLRLMLHDLADLGYVSLREAYWQDTIGHEFFLNLTAESPGSGLTRPELIDLADSELRGLDVPTWEAASPAS